MQNTESILFIWLCMQVPFFYPWSLCNEAIRWRYIFL